MSPSRLLRGAGPPHADRSRGENPTVSVVERWTGKRAPMIQTQELPRKTRRGEVKVVVPDQQTREHVRKKGAKIARPWLSPKDQDKDKDLTYKDKDKDKDLHHRHLQGLTRTCTTIKIETVYLNQYDHYRYLVINAEYH